MPALGRAGDQCRRAGQAGERWPDQRLVRPFDRRRSRGAALRAVHPRRVRPREPGARDAAGQPAGGVRRDDPDGLVDHLPGDPTRQGEGTGTILGRRPGIGRSRRVVALIPPERIECALRSGRDRAGEERMDRRIAIGGHGSGFAATARTDSWWAGPLLTFLGLTGFVVYATWAAFQGEHYYAGPYLSPFYSPLLFVMPGVPGGAPIDHAWLGPWPAWWPS